MKVKLLNRIENIVANGEIAHEISFLVQYFQKSSAAEASESVYMKDACSQHLQ